MTQQTPSTDEAQPARHEGITEIAVQGFKSLSRENRIEVRPLTILAGANSSGKSSIMQPLLLMKQTLDASSDPGPLLLNGPNAKFTSARQFLPPAERQSGTQKLSVEMILASHLKCKTTFEFSKHDRPQISAMQIVDDTEHRSLYLTPHQSSESLMDQLLASNPRWGEELTESLNVRLSVSRSRCFLDIHVEGKSKLMPQLFGLNMYLAPVSYEPVTEALNRLIHVPGLRGNRERLFVTIASGPPFPGLFEEYVATTIGDWQSRGDGRLMQLASMLADLRMAREVSAMRVNDTQIELMVGRLPAGDPSGSDLVSLADVGFGVSQVLPTLVALLVAEKDQLVYVEQPELHLHPRAQYALARIIADTAKRGVRLVVETHSALLLLRVRTLMANGDLDPALVKLHWFSRDPEDGTTSIRSADLDKDGAFGDWPEDFGDVELMAEGEYLDAVEARSRD